jgi:hypothetical protein
MPNDQKSFSAYLPFSKIEEQPDGSVMVWGRATQEIRDAAGEIMDYASSVPLFQRRSQETLDRSNGQNAFPLRAMHQPIAAGKVVQLDCIDDEKAIDICSHVVDENEVKKVKAGVYTGYSVGGKYAARWPDRDGKSVRYTADPREISLVDAPAVPTARFTLFKAEVDDDEEPPEWMGKFVEYVDAAKALIKAQQDEKDQQEQKLKTIGERVGIARRAGSPLSAPKDYPTDPDEYGDPANYAFPVDSSRASTAVGYFNGGNGAEKYSPRERNVLGRRIASLASRFGTKYQYDPTAKQIERKVEKIMPDNTLEKLDVGKLVGQLKAANAAAADLISKDPAAMKDALSMLMGHIDALDGSAPVGNAATVPATDPSTVIKAAAATAPSTSDTPTTEPTSTPASAPTNAKPAVKVDAPTKPTEPTATTTTPSTDGDETTEAYKKLEAKVDGLADSVSKMVDAFTKAMTPPPAPVAPLAKSDSSPLGALNSLVDQKPQDQIFDSPIIKALEEGGPYALLKALKAAGADEIGGSLAMQEVNNAIRKASYANLEKGGVVTSSRYSMKLLG